MKYNDLKVTSNKRSRRVGRGIAAGRGKTAGRGTKGQGARSGYSKNPGFEGGQNPLMQRLPKLPGFKSHRTKAENVSLSDISSLKLKSVNSQNLAEAGLISNPYVKVKLLGVGKIDSSVSVSLPAASASAITALESAGGKFIKVSQLHRPKSTKQSSRKSAKSTMKSSDKSSQ